MTALLISQILIKTKSKTCHVLFSALFVTKPNFCSLTTKEEQETPFQRALPYTYPPAGCAPLPLGCCYKVVRINCKRCLVSTLLSTLLGSPVPSCPCSQFSHCSPNEASQNKRQEGSGGGWNKGGKGMSLVTAAAAES